MDENNAGAEANGFPDLPPRYDLDGHTLKLVSVLENLLGLRYPIIRRRETLEERRRHILTEISRILLGYHFHVVNRHIPDDEVILQWLSLGLEHIPSIETVMLKLQQPHIQSAMCTNGVANFSYPQLNIDTSNPSPRIVDLSESSANYIIDSDEKHVYVFEAQNFLQAQLTIRTYHALIWGVLAYHLKFNLGREGSLLHQITAATPFQEPASLRALYYNARGAGLLSFRNHLNDLIDEFRPMVIIMTETRLGSGDAHQLANRIGYNQVISVSPAGYSGGIWLFSNLTNISIEHADQGNDHIVVNFLRL